MDLTTFAADGYDEIVAASLLPFYSLCEHHLLPFHGYGAHRVPAGLVHSRPLEVRRLVDRYARRLELQERLTSQIPNALSTSSIPAASSS